MRISSSTALMPERFFSSYRRRISRWSSAWRARSGAGEEARRREERRTRRWEWRRRSAVARRLEREEEESARWERGAER